MQCFVFIITGGGGCKKILATYKSGYDYTYNYTNVLQMFTITWNLGLASPNINHLEWHHE